MFSPNRLLASIASEPLHSRLIALILLCYPAILLTVRGGMGVLFFLLLILSLFSLYRMRLPHATSHWDKFSIAFALTMASPVLAIFFSQAYHGQFSARPYDWAFRFLLAIPVFLALHQSSLRVATLLQFSVPFGALVTLVTLHFHHYDWGSGRYTTEIAFNLIHFSDGAMMLGLLSLFSINLERRDPPLILIFKFCGFLAGAYMSVQTGERGAWIALPPLLLLWAISYSRERIWLKLSVAVLVVGAAAWISYMQVDMIHYRIGALFDNLNDFTRGSRDSSLGIRVQQWRVAAHLFLENPMFGVGPGGFLQAMPALSQQGMLSTEAALAGSAEIHSEIFAKGAETGIFGLMSLLSIYLIPTAIFWKIAQTATPLARRACFMGICLVAGFFVFGLTVEIFNLKMTAAFFSLTLAALMAAATSKSAH